MCVFMSMVAVWCSEFHLYYEKSSKIMNFFVDNLFVRTEMSYSRLILAYMLMMT